MVRMLYLADGMIWEALFEEASEFFWHMAAGTYEDVTMLFVEIQP